MKKILVTSPRSRCRRESHSPGPEAPRPTMTPACAGTAGSGAPACQDQVGWTGTRGTTGQSWTWVWGLASRREALEVARAAPGSPALRPRPW